MVAAPAQHHSISSTGESPMENTRIMIRTDNVALAAFLAVKGHPITGVSFNPAGFGLLEFPDEAQQLTAAFKGDEPIPAKTYIKVYRDILARIRAERIKSVTGRG